MKLKKFAVLMLGLLFLPLLSGCNGFDLNAQNLMTPPKPSGELYDVQQALEVSVSGSLVLKYPTSGEYRSAFTKVDLNNDGTNEYLAFYQTGTNTPSKKLHIGLILQHDGDWALTSEVSITATDVDSLRFADLDGDGRKDIIVGWTMYSQAERIVEAYTISGATITTRISQPYTDFITCDLNNNSVSDLLIIHQDPVKMSSEAKLFELSNDGVVELGIAKLDPAVASYMTPIQAKINTDSDENISAVFIDAAKIDGMITEVLYYDGELINSSIPSKEISNTVTFRYNSATCYDITGDGVPDIPSQTLLLKEDGRTANDAVYLTKWLSFDGKNLTTALNTVVNQADGWYIEIPKNWIDNVMVTRNTEQRSRTFFIWDKELQSISGELLRIQVLRTADIATNPPTIDTNTINLGQKGDYTYLATIGVTGTEFDITEETLKEIFRIN